MVVNGNGVFPGRFHPQMYDELEDKAFADLIDQLIAGEFGSQDFEAFPKSGRDGGTDGRFKANEQPAHPQYKWHRVSKYEGPRLRKLVHKEFAGWLADMKAQKRTGLMIFATNVERPGSSDREIDDKVAANYPEFTVKYWDYDQLRFFANTPKYHDLFINAIPSYTGRELTKKEAELAAAAQRQAAAAQDALRLSPEFRAASLKFKTQFIDWPLLYDQYIGFIYLVEPVYVNDSDEVRAIIRDLFVIDKPAEQKVLDHLHQAGRLDITGNVITVTDATAAAETARQMVEHMGNDLSEVIALIQRNQQ